MLNSVLIAGLNHLLNGADWARTRLVAYAGRQVCVEVVPFHLAMTVSADGHFEKTDGTTVSDVTIRLPANAPFLLPQGLGKLLVAAHVEGNADFATELSFIFRNLRWDIEEDLSHIVGDIAAHRLVGGLHEFLAWQKQSLDSFTGNLAEYLEFEQSLLVHSEEFSKFQTALQQLQSSLARMESRVMGSP